MENKYLNRKMVGWLSYNPNFESRDAQSRNNKVCYFYPRFLLQNGSYLPIDSKTDFPQVGRIAIWIQGSDDAESVISRYGNLVTATLNRILECNYDSNNHYTARYNYDFGSKSSEIWLTTVDASAFYEVLECFQNIDNILNSHQIDLPANFSGSTKYIMLNNHRTMYGPFSYFQQKGKLHLQGIANFDYLIGEYNAPQIERNSLIIRDNTDADTVNLLPTEQLTTNPSGCKANYDLIDDEDLLNQFLEQTKVKLDLSRKDFREIKDYITRILKNDGVIDFTDTRLKRLRSILPKIFDVQNHVLDTFTSLMTDPELSQVIVQELLKKYPDTLKASLASAVGVGYKASGSGESDGSSMMNISLSVESLPYTVINSFFNNEKLKNLVDTLQNTAQQLADKIEQVHEGNKILNSPTLELEDLISTPNFYPDYRAQLIGELDALYQCLDNITSFLDLILGRDNGNDKPSDNPAATVLNELSIRLSRVKERLTRRKQMLESDLTAEQIDLTLDELKTDGSSEIEQLHCTLADVLKNARLLTHHALAPVQRECSRLKKANLAADDAEVLSKKIAELTESKETLEQEIAELEAQKTEQEDAVKNISTDFKQILSPIKDQYQLAAKLLDHSLMQSALPSPANIPTTVMLAAPQNGQIPVIAGAQANVGVVVQTTAQALAAPSPETANVPAADTAPKTNLAGQPINVPDASMDDDSYIPSDVDNSAPVSEKPIDLKPLFNTTCLDDPTKFESRKQFIDMLSVFFNKHASRNISNNDLANYLICITQSFITTFAGEPGTGKTSLCNLLARSLGLVREDQNNRFVEISVERGWTSLKDFIGYYNPLTKRMEKSNSEVYDAFFELNKEARALKGKANSANFLKVEQLAPFFILLDEANLSPIEHYWAAFFRNCDDIVRQQRSISLGGKANWYLPENLRFLATINIDHTTEELSARFLDRSWVITLDPQTIDLNSPEANEDLLTKNKVVPFECLKKVFSPNSDDKLQKDLANKWQEIQTIFGSSECAMPIRPRNLKMVYNYCLVASGCMNCHGDNGRLAPLDYAIAQKILPTINGNGERYKTLINKLQECCSYESMPLCAKHLERMKRTGNADLGFYQFFSR